jgi:hypothetical protein
MQLQQRFTPSTRQLARRWETRVETLSWYWRFLLVITLVRQQN